MLSSRRAKSEVRTSSVLARMALWYIELVMNCLQFLTSDAVFWARS